MPRTVLLSFSRQKGRHCGHNISEAVAEVVREFDTGDKLGYVVTDNASNNTTCLKFLSEQFGFIGPEYHVRCTGHVLNIVAKAIAFGSVVDAFDADLQDLSFEDLELSKWRKTDPTGKLHHVDKYITGFPQRIEAFDDIQRKSN
ncbi:hypothetical protein WHR41_09369 [Cladosporium halotolerans]|uniref:Transposase n=1 Tax=Cladosporium halotolerans TaxID=1052096 RepID=A0AB34KDT3_9PEZI